MKTVLIPVFALAVFALAAPASAAGCSWSEKSSEKPKETVQSPST